MYTTTTNIKKKNKRMRFLAQMQHAGTCRVIGRNEEGILATLGLVERRIDNHVGLVFGEAYRLQL